MSGDESRYAHLLQPIRDVAENFNIDLAHELEDYLSELESISISFDCGKTRLNFAEAALLIQGSAVVYAKKVEYLYSLLYQTLDVLIERRKASQRNQSDSSRAISLFHEPEFLCLDDDLPAGANIDLDEIEAYGDEWHQASRAHTLSNRNALSFFAAARTDDKQQDKSNAFRLSTYSVHSSGALMLDASDGLTLDVAFVPTVVDEAVPMHIEAHVPASAIKAASSSTTTALVPSAAAGAQDVPENFGDDDAGGMEVDFDVDVQSVAASHLDDMPAPRARRGARQQAQQAQPAIDFWAEIDPHDNSGAHPKPFRRGKTSIAHAVLSTSANTPATDPTSSYLLSSLASIFDTIQDAPSFTALALAEHEPVGASTVPSALLASIAAGDPRVPVHSEIAEAFAEVAAKRKAAAAAARKQQLMLELRQKRLDFGGDEADMQAHAPQFDYADDDDDDAGWAQPQQQQHDAWEPPEFDVDHQPLEHDLAATYEDMVRSHIDAYVASSETYTSESKLSRRVSDWQSRLEPVLSEEDQRPNFDIHAYGQRTLDRIADGIKSLGLDPVKVATEAQASLNMEAVAAPVGKKKGAKAATTTTAIQINPEEARARDAAAVAMCDEKTVEAKHAQPFEKLVAGAEKYEVCRLFLATLQLANNGNVDIVHTRDSMALQLLSAAPLRPDFES